MSFKIVSVERIGTFEREILGVSGSFLGNLNFIEIFSGKFSMKFSGGFSLDFSCEFPRILC